MQHARASLRKIFSDMVRREGDAAPLLAWPLACGTKAAEHATAISFADGVLTVCVPDESWRQQLRGLCEQYVAAVNQISPQRVTAIQFVKSNQFQH